MMPLFVAALPADPSICNQSRGAVNRTGMPCPEAFVALHCSVPQAALQLAMDASPTAVQALAALCSSCAAS
ncbi:hypothetical protein ACQR14_36585, partial [Bradyrhizobium oligotrophicum]